MVLNQINVGDRWGTKRYKYSNFYAEVKVIEIKLYERQTYIIYQPLIGDHTDKLYMSMIDRFFITYSEKVLQ